jgi:hypothetical protein
MNDNVIALPTHAGSSKASVINPSANSKRPRPIVRAVDADGEELAWDPEVREQYTFVDGEAVRAGDSFAIVRPGMERWPLGHASDVYKCASHRGTVKMITEACSETVEPFQKALMSGHGYRIAHQFHVVREKEATLHDLKVTSRMTVVHDHTALHALKACMVVYVGKDAIGSLINARAIHVANNPEKWRVAVENMVERSNKAQEAILALIRAADKHVLTEADKALITEEGTNPPGGQWPLTLLDAIIKYHQGQNAEMTFGVWERRLTDDAIRTAVKVLGVAKYGRMLDEALGGKRYSGRTPAQWEEFDRKNKK